MRAAQLLLEADGVRHSRGTAEPAGARTPQLNHALGRHINMAMTFLNRRFEFVRASDLIRDGMGLECYELCGANRVLVLEAFFSDANGTFTFDAIERDLPFELVEQFMKEARKSLPAVAPETT